MAPYHRISVRVVSTLIAAVVCLAGLAADVEAQDTTPRWRAVWLDTFNSRLGSPDDVSLAVSRAAALHVNALFVQVRRRGDAFYLDASEPPPEGVAIDAGYDPLGDLLGKARSAGLEVHALVTLGPVWHLSTAPADPRHVFVRHGFGGARAVEGSDNWLTRTLQPDGNGTSVDGYRFGNDFWLDLGHPAAASYLVDLVTRLVDRYPLDGVHLDALQYPEEPSGSASVGYNAVAVARFQQRTGQTGVPRQDDGRWAAWRREQVTALARRLTVSVHAVRPSLVVSVAAVASGAAPGDPRGTAAFTRAFQDWFDWLRDGSVDAVVPQVYRVEHLSASADEFTGWMTYLREVSARADAVAGLPRPLIVGLGAYQNSAEGLLRQARVALDAVPAYGGIALFSLAANNAPVVDNSLSLPAGRDTPQRPFEDLVSVLRTGRTTGGQLVDPVQPGLFAAQVPRPALTFKNEIGDVLGRVEDPSGRAIDGAQIRLDATGRSVGPDDVVSDGTGIFAVPAVTPGSYRLVVVTTGGGAFTSDCAVDVGAAAVARVTLVVDGARAGVATCR
jgi:uncharacterized lipoprotein YddW (UPF0748 family)